MDNNFDDEIRKILNEIKFSDETKELFLSMPREEQLFAILNMESYIRAELSVVKKKQIDFEDTLERFKKELRNYRSQRERKENNRESVTDEEAQSITQKILKYIQAERAKQFDLWIWFRDKVLPVLVTGFILALFYLVYGNPPTP